MFDIKIKEVNYHYSRNCAGEYPIVKATIHIQDEYTHMVHICRTWVFDALSYVNKDPVVGPIELIIEELVKKMWTALHIPIPKERVVLIDIYLPEPADTFDMSYMNELFTKYLAHERFRDICARMLCNSRFGLLSIEPEVPNRDICTLYPEPSKYEDTDNKRLGRFLEVEAMIRDYNKKREKAKEKIKEYEMKKIEKVIFNDPATIVFWRDGSKTVVKAQDEPFDKEKGLAMAIAKKVYGNEGNYYNEFKKFIKDEPSVKVNSIEEVLDYLEPKEDDKNE